MNNPYRRFQEKERPVYHFTPESKWLNDPNGLVYYDGEYHLYHQHNWFGKVHWGHAVSRDLVHWEHQPPAIFPRQDGSDWLQPWSGTVVVDWNNTSGLQEGIDPVFLAYFTHSRQPGDEQAQSMAYSNDRGYTWKEFDLNPVVPNPGVRDFRDPKVFWHEETGRWIMALVAGDHVKFYASACGLEWSQVSEFGQALGSHGGVWECPDLFPIKVEGEETEKWVLIISVGGGSIAGGTGMQYFIGHFDGERFTADVLDKEVCWVDYGQDFYAAISWNDMRDGRRLWIGWMNNWPYANSLPTTPYQGQMSIVRELRLVRDYKGQLFISQHPVDENKALRKGAFSWESVSERREIESMFTEVRCECFELAAEVTWENESPPNVIELKVRQNDEQYTTIGFCPMQQTYYLDRNNSGILPHPLFGGRHEAKREERFNLMHIRVLIDRQSIEVFADHGKYVLSDLIFPQAGSDRLEWNISGGKARIVECTLYPFKSAFASEPDKPELPGHALSGQWSVTSQGIEGASAENGMWLFSEALQDFEISAEIDMKQSFGSGGASGLAIRLNESGSKGYLSVYEADSQTIGLYRLTAVGHELVQRVSWEWMKIRKVRMSVKVCERNIEILLNGSSVINVFEANAYLGGFSSLYTRQAFTLFNEIEVLSL